MKNSRDGRSYSTNLAFTPPEYLRTGKTLSTLDLCGWTFVKYIVVNLLKCGMDFGIFILTISSVFCANPHVHHIDLSTFLVRFFKS